MNFAKKTLLVVSFLATTWSMARCEFRLQVLHTNDMHSRFQETNAHSGSCVKRPCYGGFARLKTAVDQFRGEARREGRSSIFLNAGDTYQGTVFFTLFRDKIVTELVNMMGIDVMSLGNHEFDNKPAGLAPFIANSSVPIVCCNIDYSREPALASAQLNGRLVPSTVLDVDGVKVGVVGYLTPETKFIASVGEVDIHDEIEDIKKEVSKLKESGVKILIALGHSGFTSDKKIAEHVPDLDLVVGGHTNTFLFNGQAPSVENVEGNYPTVVKQASGREVRVVQAYAYTKYLGRLELTFNDEGEVTSASGNPVLIDESYKKDDEVNQVVLRYETEANKTALTRRVGTTKVFLEADVNCRIRECNFGNLAADAFVYISTKDYHNNKSWTDTPIALVHGGGLRNSITNERSGGAITTGDLMTTMPFENTIQRLTMAGRVLEEVLENSVAQYSLEERKGGFLQFSGIQVTYDISRPPQRRVVSALVRCGDCLVPKYYPLDRNKVYEVLVSSFLADGGDNYGMLKSIKERKDLSFGDRLAVQEYISGFSFLYPEVSGRIQFVKTEQKSPNKASTSTVTDITLLLLCSSMIQLSSQVIFRS